MIRTVNGRNIRILGANAESIGEIPSSIIYLNYIPNSFISNGTGTPDFAKLVPDVIIFRAAFTKTGTQRGHTFRLWWNTLLNVSGATQLATFQIANTVLYAQFYRRILFTSSNTARIMNFNFDSNTDVGDYNTTLSTVTISPNWTTVDGYFFFTCDQSTPLFPGPTDTIKSLYFSAEI